MKKIILIIVSLLIFSTSFANYKQELEKYYSPTTVDKVENLLNSWNKKVLQKTNPEKVYNNVLSKIDKLLEKKLSLKIKIVVLYLKEKIKQFKQDYEKKLEQKNNILTGNQIVQEEKKELKIITGANFSLLNRDSIIVPNGQKYAILGFYFKSLYGDSTLHSLLFKNEFGNDFDLLVNKVYLVDINKKILSEANMVNGIVYFELKKPYLLKRDFNTSFYVLVKLNNINNQNLTNKKIKLKFLKNYNTFKTKVVSNVNGEEVDYYIFNSFNSNTYFARKSKPIISADMLRARLHIGSNKIYSLNIASTGGNIALSKLIFDVNISTKASVDTGNLEVYIDNARYKKLNAYFTNETGNSKLIIDFDKPYFISSNKKIDIVANFTKVRNKAYFYIKLNQKSDLTDIVAGTYIGETSILWSDDSIRGVLEKTTNDYFTDALVNYDNVKDTYLKDN